MRLTVLFFCALSIAVPFALVLAAPLPVDDFQLSNHIEGTFVVGVFFTSFNYIAYFVCYTIIYEKQISKYRFQNNLP
jgi:hypothetical protein